MKPADEIQISVENEVGGGGGGGSPENSSLLQRVREFFETIIGRGAWLRPVPDACHFAEKLPRKLPENPEFTFEKARVLNLESLVIWLRDSVSGQVVSCLFNLAQWMSNHLLGCFAFNESEVRSAPA